MSRVVLCLAMAMLLMIPAVTHAATGRVECNKVQSRILARSVSYCVVLPASFDTKDTKPFPIVYALHGLGDNEQFFVHSGLWNLVEDLQQKGELREFLIATPDGGAGFYINSKDGKNGYEDFLLQEFIPLIEKRYRAAAGRGNRAISGVSMGGYGALHMAFKHPQLVASAGAHSAGLLDKFATRPARAPQSTPARV